MTLEELLKTEGRDIEFKLEMPLKDIAFLKMAVAFANCHGGRFVFGIRNEDHAVIGINDETLFQDLDTITNIISDNCESTYTDFNPMGNSQKSQVKNVGDEGSSFAVVLQLLKGNPLITAKELATKLHTATRTAERILRQLKQYGRIRRSGNTRTGYWIVEEI